MTQNLSDWTSELLSLVTGNRSCWDFLMEAELRVGVGPPEWTQPAVAMVMQVGTSALAL